ncbi:MAG: N-acetylmuramoyl-L-alanine amidase [Clostridia bacterium]|nr:N-acetylmuramoyl-L-alanine amidase [Clostridia bacterium]
MGFVRRLLKSFQSVPMYIKGLILVLFIAIPIVTCVASTDVKQEAAVNAYINFDETKIPQEEVLPEEPKVPREPLIVIDPGHGGEEWGTYRGDMIEKNINLDISLRMGRLLKDEGIKIAYTREKDVYLGLKERANFANDLNADLFISVHNNDMPGQPDYKGTETLYCPPQKPVFDSMDGQKLATIVQRELVKTLKTVDNGTIYRPNLAVIRRTKMPAVIAEIGYITNASDRARLASAEFRQKAALALANAVKKAIEVMGAKKQDDGKWLINNQ